MKKLIFVSGPCGTGKSTFADAYARHIVNSEHKTVYVIHGDDFHAGFVEPEDIGDLFADGKPADLVVWKDILSFNWDCIINTADRALKQGIDVVIDYIIEDEMPRVKKLASDNDAQFYYIVLDASEEELEKRIRERGDVEMIERSLFLKKKLEQMPESKGHLFDNTQRSVEETVNEIILDDYLMGDI